LCWKRGFRFLRAGPQVLWMARAEKVPCRLPGFGPARQARVEDGLAAMRGKQFPGSGPGRGLRVTQLSSTGVGVLRGSLPAARVKRPRCRGKVSDPARQMPGPEGVREAARRFMLLTAHLDAVRAATMQDGTGLASVRRSCFDASRAGAHERSQQVRMEHVPATLPAQGPCSAGCR